MIIAGHETSITMEDIFWEQLKLLADRKCISLNTLITRVDANRAGNLSSALRVFVLEALMTNT